MKKIIAVIGLCFLTFDVIFAENISMISRLYGNYYVPAIEQNPGLGIKGTLNQGFGSSGFLDISAQLDSSIAHSIQVTSDGLMLVSLANENNSVIAAYYASGKVATNYGTSGVCTLLNGVLNPLCMQLDHQNNLFVAGHGGWLQRISPVGIVDTNFIAAFTATAGSWNFISAIGLQSDGKILIAGLKNGWAQVARFSSFGTLDTTFATNGFLIFNGSGDPALPISASGVSNIAVDSHDQILIAYKDAITDALYVAKFDQDGNLATSFGTNGIRTNIIGDVAVQAAQIRTAFLSDGNIVVGAGVDSTPAVVQLRILNAMNGNDIDGAVSMQIPETGSNSIQLTGLQTLTDGSILAISTDITMVAMRTDQFHSNGERDFAYNPDSSQSYLEFNIPIQEGTLITSALLSGAFAPTGQLYAVGYQVAANPSLQIPYIINIYDAMYQQQINQTLAQTVEQGIIDTQFGSPVGISNAKQTYAGVVNPYFGKYRGNLQQHATAIIQYQPGDLLVGMYGLHDQSDPSFPVNMMLNIITPEGFLDELVGNNYSGQILLDNETSASEYVYALGQDSTGAVYVAGKSENNGAILRQYTSESTSHWTDGMAYWSVLDTTYESAQGIGVGAYGQDIVLLFENLQNGQGRIVGYNQYNGLIANGDEGSQIFGKNQAGSIDATSYDGLFMGPVYGGVVNDIGTLFVAYKNFNTGFVDVAAFAQPGTSLLVTFANNGIFSNLFDSLANDNIAVEDIRIAFDQAKNLVVAAVVNGIIKLAKINQVSGALDQSFGNNGIVSLEIASPSITQLQGLSDGALLVSGSIASQAMYLARLLPDGSLDISFNQAGAQPGVATVAIGNSIAQAEVGAFALQTTTGNQGNIVLAGFEEMQVGDALPIVTRLFGAPGTMAIKNYPDQISYLGTLDTNFNNSGCLNLSSLIAQGSAQVVYTYPFGNQYQGLLLVGINADDVCYLARFNPITLQLDPTFNAQSDTPGYYVTDVGITGMTCMTVDAKNRIVFAGYTDERDWAYRLDADGSFDTTCNLGGNITEIQAVGQQKSGRYIFAMKITEAGYGLCAFQDELIDENSSLQLDETFNPTGINPGNLLLTAGPIYSIIINDDDTIMCAWMASWVNNHMYVGKVCANGSGYVTSFGQYGIQPTSIDVLGDATTVKIAADASGNILAAASTSVDDISIVRLLAEDGSFDPNWNGGQVLIVNGCGHSVKLTQLLESTAGQTILLGYNTLRRVNGINGPLFTVSLDSTGNLDSSWNPYPSGADVPGILTYHIDGSTVLTSGAFTISGNLFTVGGNGTDPLIMEILDDAIPVEQTQLAVDAGILDTTINTQSTGYDSLNLNTLTNLTLGIPACLSLVNNTNGAMFMASQLDTTSYITKFNAALQLDYEFNPYAQAPSTVGMIAIEGTSSIEDLFVDDAVAFDTHVFATGTTQDGVMWASKYSHDGIDKLNLIAQTRLSQGTAIRPGADKILIAGQSLDDGNFGAIVAVDSMMRQVDLSFGNGTPGYFIIDRNVPISAMAIDNQYRIYIAYKEHGFVKVQRLSADGSSIDYTAENEVFACNPRQIEIYLDQDQQQFVVGNYHESGLYITRYNMADGSLAGSCQINVESENLKLSSLVIDTDQNIYVIGYNGSANYQTVVARINSVDRSTLALDQASYAVDSANPGVAHVAVTPMNTSGFTIGGGVLHPDRRIYVVGATSDGIPYMSRFFGNNYAQQVDESIAPLVPGDFDITYGPDSLGYATTFAGAAPYYATSQQQVKSIFHLPGTMLMTAIDDGVDSWTLRVLQDGTNDPLYGDLQGQGMLIDKLDGNETISAMILSGAQEYIAIGSNSNQGGYLKKILPNGNMKTDFGGFTGQATTQNYPAGTVYNLMTNPCDVVELSDGSIIVAGSDNGVGVLQKIGTTGIVVSDFMPLDTAISGVNVSSMVADSQNNLFVTIATRSLEVFQVDVAKLTADGSLVWQQSNVLPAMPNAQAAQIAFDPNGNLLVAATSTDFVGNFNVIKLLAQDGSIDPDFNSGSSLMVTLPNSSLSAANVTDVVGLQDGRILVSGYQQDVSVVENNAQFVACITSYGELDTAFNRDLQQGLQQGIALFATGNAQEQGRMVYSMDIQSDGKILLAASQSPAAEEQIPLTIRLLGFDYDQAIVKYPGQAIPTVSVLNPAYGISGVAGTADAIDNLLSVAGPVAVDTQGRTIVTGVLQDGTMLCARFLPEGILDTSFGFQGLIAYSQFSNLLPDCAITVDAANNIYIASATLESQFVVVAFDSLGNILTSFGQDGLLISYVPNLAKCSSIQFDIAGDDLLLGGYCVGALILQRYSADGQTLQDSITLHNSDLISGGYVVADTDYSVYISGQTASGLLVAKYDIVDDNFVLDVSYGVAGVATILVPGLVTGGPLVLDFYRNGVIGGYTSDLQFVIARLTGDGQLDTTFNSTGIAYGAPITNLQTMHSVAIGNLNDVAIAGTARNYNGDGTICMSVFTNEGNLNEIFAPAGTAIIDVVSLIGSYGARGVIGGYLAVNDIGQFYIGGAIYPTVMSQLGTQLFVAQAYSGYQTIIEDPKQLPVNDYKVYFYGNNPDFFNQALAVGFCARGITNNTIRTTVIDAIQGVMDNYIDRYAGAPGYNLTTHVYLISLDIQALQSNLVTEYPNAADQINACFTLLLDRMAKLKLS